MSDNGTMHESDRSNATDRADLLRRAAEQARDKGTGGRSSDQEDAVSPVLVRVSDVPRRDVEWFWPDRFAIGKLNMISGDPGLGKSFVTLDMLARVTTGTPWPDGTACDRGSGILISAEDDLADTIGPRLDAAGADTTRIVSLQAVNFITTDGKRRERSFTLDDVPQLEQALRATPDCRLVVIDPVSAYMGRKDSHKNSDVRGMLAPLSKLAADHGVCVVMVTHLSKSGGGRAMYRGMGSIAFNGAARSAWLVVQDKAEPARRLFLPVKNNVGNDRNGLAYRIRPGAQDTPCVVWEKEKVTITADEALATLENGEDGDKRRQQKEAEQFLREFLADGPKPAREVEKEADEAGIAKRTLRRARERIGVRPAKTKGDPAGAWMWSLPPTPVVQGSCPPDVPVGNLAFLDTMDIFPKSRRKAPPIDPMCRVRAEDDQGGQDAQPLGAAEQIEPDLPSSRPTDASRAGRVKMFLTAADERALRGLGYDDVAIARMRPEEGQRIIDGRICCETFNPDAQE